MMGKVYLVGAGPGDPELLTVRALRVLRQADAVLHDDLVPASIVSLAAAGAEILNVGKRCGKRSIKQAEINARLIAGARQGLMVVRLKGGDPAFFSRAGEEIEALREAGVDFEIVPGVTAASAAAATAGIALTQRDLSSSVVFLTGHRASTCQSQVQMPEQLCGKTLVIYMPGPDYRALQAQLQAAGVPGETPCVLVSAAHITRRVDKTTVAGLASAPMPAAPAVLIVGAVARSAREPQLTMEKSLTYIGDDVGLRSPAFRRS